MIEDTWPRIAGLHVGDSGVVSAAWIAINPDTSVTHLYDCCKFKALMMPVLVDGLNARGRRIPIAWASQEMADVLWKNGCNMLREPIKETPALVEIHTSEIVNRMQTGRFKVSERLQDWLEEFRTFNREDAKIPTETHPLMTATRYAISEIRSARAEETYRQKRPVYPKRAIV